MLISYQTMWWLSSSLFRTAFRHLPARKHMPKHPLESNPLVPFAALISCYGFPVPVSVVVSAWVSFGKGLILAPGVCRHRSIGSTH